MNSLEIILIASVMGLTAGISPGPLLTLVLTQTLKHNRKEGVKVALAPLITDVPIILVAVLVFNQLSEFNFLLGIISLAGGVFVAWLGYQSIRTKGLDIERRTMKSNSFAKGIFANFLSPHPYLFWATIGVPYLFQAADIGWITAAVFLAAFYGLLVGSKISVAILFGQSKLFMGNKTYSIILRILGIILLLFSILFFRDGLLFFRLI